jgi:hypothetical protein
MMVAESIKYCRDAKPFKIYRGASAAKDDHKVTIFSGFKIIDFLEC